MTLDEVLINSKGTAGGLININCSQFIRFFVFRYRMMSGYPNYSDFIRSTFFFLALAFIPIPKLIQWCFQQALLLLQIPVFLLVTCLDKRSSTHFKMFLTSARNTVERPHKEIFSLWLSLGP